MSKFPSLISSTSCLYASEKKLEGDELLGNSYNGETSRIRKFLNLHSFLYFLFFFDVKGLVEREGRRFPLARIGYDFFASEELERIFSSNSSGER